MTRAHRRLLLRVPVTMPPPHDLDTLEQQLQLRDIDLTRVHPIPVGQKTALLEPLGPNAPAAAIEIEHLDLCRATIDEREQMACQRIDRHRVACDCVQAIERASHVDWCAVQEHAYLLFREEHQLLAIVRTMPPGRSRRIVRFAVPAGTAASIRAPAVGIAPRSTKDEVPAPAPSLLGDTSRCKRRRQW